MVGGWNHSLVRWVRKEHIYRRTLLLICNGGMKHVKKLILGIVFCMLLLLPVLSISCEAKQIVFITGKGCDGFTGANYNDMFASHGLFPFWNYVRSNQSGNYVIFYYHANPIFMLINGVPRIIKQPSSIKLGLTEPQTLAIVKEFILNPKNPNAMGARVFSICDSIEVEPIN